MEILVDYDWPGNIRQLKSAIKAAVIACDGDTLTADSFRVIFRTAKLPMGCSRIPFTESVLDYERRGIEQALQQSNGQVGGHGGAAELLGISVSKAKVQT